MEAVETTTRNLPRLKLPESKKTPQWHEQCAKAFMNMSRFGRSGTRQDTRKLYDYYVGNAHEEDYTYVLSPYGQSFRKQFPSRLRNYPIIKPVVDLLLGEKAKRPFNYTVVHENGNSYSLKDEERNKITGELIEKKFTAAVYELSGGAMGSPGGPSTSRSLETTVKLFEENYRDAMAIIGQKSMNYIVQKNRVRNEFLKGWFDFLVTGEVYSHKGISGNDLFYEMLASYNVDYDNDPLMEFVEDGDWAIARQEMYPSSVLDRFSKYLTDDQVKALENPTQGSIYPLVISPMSERQTYDDDERNRLIEVIYVYWKSFKRVGFVLYYSEETDSLEERIVEDGYEEQEGEYVTWEWVPDIRQTTIIDQKHFINSGPYYDPRKSMEDPASQKLPINGRKYITTHTNNTSLVALGIPYQIQYNIYKYRLELEVAKSKGVISMFDINMVPKGWSTDKFMYYLDALGIAWVSYNKEAPPSPQHQTMMDLSIKTISAYVELLESILLEWERVSGVSQQRQGDIGPYESVAGSQQAIIQSSHITEDWFRKYAEFEERELQGLLDLSKIAWVRGKKTSFVMPEGTVEYLQSGGLDYAMAELGVFIKDSAKEQEKFQKAELLAQPMLQNGYRSSDILEIIDSDNFAEIKQKIRIAEARAEALNQEMAKYQAENERAMDEREHMQEEALQANELDFKYAELDANMFMRQIELSKSDSADTSMSPEEREKLRAETAKIRQEVQASRQEVQQRNRELDLKDKDLRIQEKLGMKKIAVDKIKARQKPASATSKKK